MLRERERLMSHTQLWMCPWPALRKTYPIFIKWSSCSLNLSLVPLQAQRMAWRIVWIPCSHVLMKWILSMDKKKGCTRVFCFPSEIFPTWLKTLRLSDRLSDTFPSLAMPSNAWSAIRFQSNGNHWDSWESMLMTSLSCIFCILKSTPGPKLDDDYHPNPFGKNYDMDTMNKICIRSVGWALP